MPAPDHDRRSWRLFHKDKVILSFTLGLLAVFEVGTVFTPSAEALSLSMLWTSYLCLVVVLGDWRQMNWVERFLSCTWLVIMSLLVGAESMQFWHCAGLA